jgi:hypothetical protein
MDTQTIINVLIGIAGVLIGWMVKDVKDNHKELKSSHSALEGKVQKIEVLVVGDYVTNDDFEKVANSIFNKLDRIETLLHNKADRPK